MDLKRGSRQKKKKLHVNDGTRNDNSETQRTKKKNKTYSVCKCVWVFVGCGCCSCCYFFFLVYSLFKIVKKCIFVDQLKMMKEKLDADETVEKYVSERKDGRRREERV